MSLKISSSAISKLNHEITEIRVRTLKHIEAKILKAILYDEDVIFNPGILIKQLIRWFGQKPLCEEESALNIMITLIKSKYIHEIVIYLGLQRLKKEIDKIWEIVKISSCRILIKDIKTILDNYEEPDPKYDLSKKSETEVHTIDLCSMIEAIDEISYELEEPWSIPHTVDYNSLKFLSDALHHSATEDDLQHAFKYLKNALNDYPAEFFLQPPNIFHKILKLYRENKSKRDIVLIHLKNLAKALTGRVKMRQLSKVHCPSEAKKGTIKPKTQISIANFCSEMLITCIENIRDWNEDLNQSNLLRTYELLMEIINLMDNDPHINLSISTFLVDLGYIAKYIRQTLRIDEKPSRVLRTQYVLILYIICRLVNCSYTECSDNENCSESSKALSSSRKEYKDANFIATSARNENNFIGDKTIWLLELESASLDYSLMQFYPNIYELVNKSKMAYTKIDDEKIKIIFECDKWLRPAVNLLRQCEELPNEEIIHIGLKAIETLHIHRSTDLIEILFKTISKCIPLFDGNPKLKESAEKLTLLLLAHEDLKIKKLAYKLSADNMKSLFGGLMSGENTLKKSYGKELRKAKTFGIPLTTEILTEIICFGYQHSEPIIHMHAETMLCLVIKGKPLLGNVWESILEILLPNMPLLQCVVVKASELGALVINFYDPDNDIPLLDIIQGNIRFLFSEDDLIRKEALSRLTFILSMHLESHHYLPNIVQIIDTLPCDVCILSAPRDPEKIFCEGLYEESTLYTLIELIRAPDADPTIRKTALMQLNIICQDPKLNQLVHDENGWYPVLQVLENSLKQVPTTDFTEAAIPCVGIILKIIFCNPQFRREISNEINIYFHLLRTLLLFYDDSLCQNDCSIALFLLAFSSYTIGCRNITIPQICSKLKLPIKCDFHWNTSPYKQRSLFEDIYLQILKNEQSKITKKYSLYSNHCSSATSTPRGFEIQDEILKWKNTDEFVAEEVALEYIRLSFAKLWFDGMDSFLKLAKNSKNDKKIDYTVLPGHLYPSDDNVVEIFETLNFDEKLIVTKNDLRIIECSSPSNNISYFLKKISNATSQLDVLSSTTGIRIILLIFSRENIKVKSIINAIKKFLVIPPYSDLDQILFQNIIKLSNRLIMSGDQEVFNWFFENFRKNNCIFFNYLKNKDISMDVYQNITELLKTWIKSYIEQNKTELSVQYSLKESSATNNNINIYNKLFEIIFPILEEFFHEKDLEKLRYLLSLLQSISSSKSVELDSGFIHVITKKLLHFIITLKSYTEAGSHINKNCLYIIGNLMCDVEELNLEPANVKFLSGLCGHIDLEIRALSWCILEKISTSLKGARLLVKELAFLPGGFHACCISTLLDITEASIVRITSGQILANLLQYTVNNSELDLSVAPLCKELEPSSENNGYNLIVEIFSRHKFYDRIQSGLDYFYVSDIILTDLNCEITTCDVVNSFCSVLTNFIDIKPVVVPELSQKPFVIRIFDLIKTVPSCVTKTSLNMVAGICNLLIRFILNDSNFLDRFIIHGLEIIVVLIHLIDLRFYENSEKTPLIYIIQVLQILINDTFAFENVSKTFSVIEFGKIISTLVYGLSYSQNKDLQGICLEFTTALLLKSQSDTFQFDTFQDLLDTIILKNLSVRKDLPDYQTKEPKALSLDSLNNNIKDMEKDKIVEKSSSQFYMYGSEILSKEIISLFQNVCSNEKGNYSIVRAKRKTLVCENLAILLKTSSKAHDFAISNNFLATLIARFNFILKEMGMPCTDFIRKYNDSKKGPVVEELILLFGIILNWYSSSCLVDETHILQLSKIFIKFWPWLGCSVELRINFLNCLAFLSEHSIPVCKQFSSAIPNCSETVLQLVGNLVVAETSKLKQPSNDLKCLRIGLRTISNCCSCIEGRLQIIKLNLLDVISRFHPSVTKLQKAWNPIILMWLEMWEIFSRHPEGSVVRHIYLLCVLVAKASTDIRQLCLSILRNMAFLNTNRPALLSSEDFLYTIQSMLKNGTSEEQLLMCTAIWKLVAGNYKAKHAMKNTSIPIRLKNISSELCSKQCKISCENDLKTVIEILLKILYE